MKDGREQKKGRKKLAAICSPELESHPGQGEYRCLADNNQRCYRLDAVGADML